MSAANKLEGHRSGRLVAVRRVTTSRNGHARWLCDCDCGNTHEVFATHLVKGVVTHCGCDKYSGIKHRDWKGAGDISGNLWHDIRSGAVSGRNRRQLAFEITIDYAWALFLKQERRCALSGVEIHFLHEDGSLKRFSKTASLDRIDSSIGYVEGNVQWVHKYVNLMKGRMDEVYFLEFCRKVAKFQESKSD